MPNSPHVPVLLNEVVDSFQGVSNGIFVDCTLGYGGHSSAILEHYEHLSLIGIDRDIEAHKYCKKTLSDYGNRVEFIKGSFSEIVPTLGGRHITALLADFGVSSLQLDETTRGFSFDSDMLDMRMDQSAKLNAKKVVNEYTATKLEYIFKHYGEISQSKKLADAIVASRVSGEISSSKELSKIIASALPFRGKIHPSTLAFQAIRIEVNDELGEIERLLETLEQMQPSGAIISLITFHSLEDRLVKNRFRHWGRECICPDGIMRCECGKNNSLGKIITKKPIVASKDEIKVNPRSRSAKLRTFKFKERD